MHSLLDTASGKADLVLIQEPWISNQNTTVTHNSFRTLIPHSHTGTPHTSALLCLKTQHLSTSRTPSGPPERPGRPTPRNLSPDTRPGAPLQIHTISGTTHEEPHGRQTSRILTNQDLTTRTILAGDFNAHHPWWNSIATENGTNAGLLVSVMERNEQIPFNQPDVQPTSNGTFWNLGSGLGFHSLISTWKWMSGRWRKRENHRLGPHGHVVLNYPHCHITLDSPFPPG